MLDALLCQGRDLVVVDPGAVGRPKIFYEIALLSDPEGGMQARDALGIGVERGEVYVREDRLAIADPPDGVVRPSLQWDDLTGADDVQVDLRAADRNGGGRFLRWF